MIQLFLCRHYKYEQKLSSLFWKIEFKDIIMGDIDSAEPEIKIKVRGFASRFDFSHVNVACLPSIFDS